MDDSDPRDAMTLARADLEMLADMLEFSLRSDAQVNRRIAELSGWYDVPYALVRFVRRCLPAPNYMGDIRAAMSLMAPDDGFIVASMPRSNFVYIDGPEGMNQFRGCAKTLPMAISAAALRSKAASHKARSALKSIIRQHEEPGRLDMRYQQRKATQ